MNAHGNWDINVLRVFLPVEDINRIMLASPPRILNDDDEFHWMHTADGSFSTKSAYLAIKATPPLIPQANFMVIWKWNGPERIKIFLWKALNKVLLTNA